MRHCTGNHFVSALILFGLVGSIYAEENASSTELRPSQDYLAEKGEPVTYEVDFKAIVTAPYKTRVLRVWVPLPQDSAAQVITGSELSTFPTEITPKIGHESTFGNKFAYFEIRNPQGGQIFQHRFTAQVWELNWDLNPSRVESVEDWPREFGPYLAKHAELEQDPDYQAIMESIARSNASRGNQFQRAMSWIDRSLTYDHVNASLAADPVHALTQRRGHCSDYHGLCGVMGRSIGYPTRVTYGLSLYPKSSPSHCKIEAFLPPHGWVSFDLSETQKMVKRIEAEETLSGEEKKRLIENARRRLMAGFRENTWLHVTSGTNYDLEPPAENKVKVVRTIYAEADGVALKEPDPANLEQSTFSWMTAHRYKADREVTNPFHDISSLLSPSKH